MFILEDEEEKEKAGGDVEDDEHAVPRHEVGDGLVDHEEEEQGHRGEGGPLDPSELLLGGQELEVEEGLDADEECEEDEGEEGEELYGEAVGVEAGPEGLRADAIKKTRYFMGYSSVTLRSGSRRIFLAMRKAALRRFSPAMEYALPLMKSESGIIQ